MTSTRSLRRRGAHRFDERRDGVGQVLAVVEHQQQALRREHGRDRLDRRAVGAQLRAQHARHGGGHQRAVGQRRQLDPPDAVGKLGGRLVGDLRGHGLRDARLADAARADDGDDGVLRAAAP